MVTLQEASNETGVSIRTLRRWIAEGKLTPVMRQGTHGPTNYVQLVDIERLRGKSKRKQPQSVLIEEINELKLLIVHQTSLIDQLQAKQDEFARQLDLQMKALPAPAGKVKRRWFKLF